MKKSLRESIFREDLFLYNWSLAALMASFKKEFDSIRLCSTADLLSSEDENPEEEDLLVMSLLLLSLARPSSFSLLLSSLKG